jgi:hypothetical protein
MLGRLPPTEEIIYYEKNKIETFPNRNKIS